MPKVRLSPNLGLRTLSAARGPETFLPDVVSIRLDDDYVDTGGGEFTYPRNGRNASVLGDRVPLILQRRDLNERRNSRFYIVGQRDDAVGEDVPCATWLIRNLIGRLAEARVIPRDGDAVAAPYVYEGATFGAILNEHLNRAKGLGGSLPEVSWNFTTTLDSAGVAWASMGLNWSVDVGVTILELLKRGRAAAQVDGWWFDGDTLNVVGPGAGTDHTVPGIGESAITLWRGQDLLNGQRSRETPAATAVLVTGDGGRYATAIKAGTAPADVVWASVTAPAMTTQADLDSLAADYLALYGHVRETVTYDLVLGWGTDPYTTYNIGDWLFVVDDLAPAAVRRRVRKIGTELDTSGMVLATITVDDWLSEADQVLADKLDALTQGGSGDRGGLPPGPDRLPPAAPTWQATPLTTESYDPPAGVGGVDRARVLVHGVAPTLDGDGDPLTDLASIVAEWRYVGRPGWERVSEPDAELEIPNLDHGRDVVVRLIAVDRSRNESPPSATQTITTAASMGRVIAYQPGLLDAAGPAILDTRDGLVRVSTAFAIGDVPGYTPMVVPAVDGIAPAASGPGLLLDALLGFQAFGVGGGRTVWVDPATGDTHLTGNLFVGGVTVIGGDTTIHDDVSIDGDTIIGGTLQVVGVTTLGGDLSLAGDLDAAGFNITGAILTGAQLKTTGDAIVISGTTIEVGSATIEFQPLISQVKFSTGINTTGASTFGGAVTVNGTSAFNGDVKIGSSATSLFGCFGSTGSQRQTLLVAGRSNGQKVDDLIALLSTKYNLFATA